MLTVLFAIVLLTLALFLGLCVVAIFLKAFFDGLAG